MKIVILDAYAANPGDLSWDEFAALGELTVYDRTAQEDAAARIGDAEVVFINKVRLTDEIFAACPNLKLVSILATGYNIVDLAAAKRRGITVCNVPGYSTRAVVQMTFALLLEICQQVGLHSGAVHTGRVADLPGFLLLGPAAHRAGRQDHGHRRLRRHRLGRRRGRTGLRHEAARHGAA